MNFSAMEITVEPAVFTSHVLTAKHFADALMMGMVGIAIPTIPETRLHA